MTFVCLGNVCRSPFAAVVFERLGGRSDRSILVRSAGFIGPNRSSPESAIAAADRLGFDLRGHRSQLLTSTMVGDSDLIVVMAASQAADVRRGFAGAPGQILILGDLDPQPVARRTVLDPWGCNDEVFDNSYARIQRCVGELARLVTR